MKPAAPTAVIVPHLHPDRRAWHPGRADLAAVEATTPGCPGCGRPLVLGPAGSAGPDRRSVGVCDAPRCGQVVTFRRLEGRLIVLERSHSR